MMNIIAIVFLLNCYVNCFAYQKPNAQKQLNKYTINGIVKDINSGETLPYVNIAVNGKSTGTISNQYGFYSLTLPEGQYVILFTCIGYEDYTKGILLNENIRLDAEISVKSHELEEVVVSADKKDIAHLETSMSKIEGKTVKELPALFGEPDMLRTISLLPGVTNISEGTCGYLVRGGGWDQNLMLLDEATVYNANHLIGLYSTFNPDIIKDYKFYKSDIPASYGGRASSVIDITQKDGNMKSYYLDGGIGLITSRLKLEGPIIKEKSSFIIAARRSYVDLFFFLFPDIKDVKTYFYDLNSKINYIINDDNRIYLSCYLGNDLTNVSSYDEEYGNVTGTLRYNHIYSRKLFSNISVIFSRYKMINSQSDNDWSWKNNKGLDHYELKNTFTCYLARHKIEFGLKGIYYVFYPGNLEPVGDSSEVTRINIPKQYAFEPAVYVSDNIQLGSKFEVQLGIRVSDFMYLGPSDVYIYSDLEPRDPTSIIDTLNYKRNETIESYYHIEPRVSIKYDLNKSSVIKVSYIKMAQNIQQISNTLLPTPYNMWKASNNYIKPLISHQFSVGYFSEIFHNVVDLSFEIYYKMLDNVIEVKPGTDIVLNETLEAGLLQGKGRSYGMEIMAKKNRGKLTGLVSYTWSRTEKKINGKFKEEKINFGDYYPSDYDIPHKVTLAGELKINKRLSLTAQFNFLKGRPTTYPSGQYVYFNTLIPYYSSKNLDRLDDVHRLDIGCVLNNKQKENRKWKSNWVFSLYNIYARQNTYSIYIRRKTEAKNTEAVKLWLFSIVPSISYNFRF